MRETSLMTVSVAKGIYKEVNRHKIAHGRFFTHRKSWLTPPVVDFIEDRKAVLTTALDPFAGEGHLLAPMQEFGFAVLGYDISKGRWPYNDSLVSIPTHDNTIIVTNPPFLAKHSASRKGVYAQVAPYFSASPHGDLYQIAIDRCLTASDYVVALLPETVLWSGYRLDHLERVCVLTDNPFTDTTVPVCVTCWDKNKPRNGSFDIYHGTDKISWNALKELALMCVPKHNTPFRFNDPHGQIALRAIDGILDADRIGFLKASEFRYQRTNVKASSRLMTCISAPVADKDIDYLISGANAELSQLRALSHDLLLSPFKGNTKTGRRRRRLDYTLARYLLEKSLLNLT